VDIRTVDPVRLKSAIAASNEAEQAREAYARQQAALARVQAQILAVEKRAEREKAREEEEQAQNDADARAEARERRHERVAARRAAWEAQRDRALTAQQTWWTAQQQAASAWADAFNASPSYLASGGPQPRASGHCDIPPVPKSWSSLQDLQQQLDAGTRDFDRCEKKASTQHPAAAPSTNPLAGYGETASGYSTTAPAQQSSSAASSK